MAAAVLQVANANGYFFADALDNDAVLGPTGATQRLLVGAAASGTLSALSVGSNVLTVNRSLGFSNATGSSALYSVGSNLGVGTTTPSCALDVAGNVSCTYMGAGNLGMFRNRLINADFRLNQRFDTLATTVSSTTCGGSNLYHADRFQAGASLSTSGTFTVARSNLPAPLSGFVSALKIVPTTPSSMTTAVNDAAYVAQTIEGANVADLNWGTANAAPTVLSFWTYGSNLTGTFSVAVQNGALSRSYVSTYAIGTANTWTKQVIRVPGDTAGVWDTSSNAGARVQLTLGAGTARSTASINSWQASSNVAATGAGSVLASSTNQLFVTGMQFEIGTLATPFELRPNAIELVLCQRYYELMKFSVGGGYSYINWANNTTTGYPSFAQMKVTKRTNNATVAKIMVCGNKQSALV
jgi:hypothetical protein